MTSLPLHPAIVHLPLALAFVMPALAVWFCWALWTGRPPYPRWATVVALQAILLVAGLAAMNTGEREEDRVERLVPHAALEQHEALAEQFVWATAGTLLLAGLVLLFRKPAMRRTLTVATIAGTVVVAASAVRAGRAGGRLVYEHNAGAAYSAPTQPSRATVTDAADRRRRRDHNDH